jgi:hypothetical protein
VAGRERGKKMRRRRVNIKRKGREERRESRRKRGRIESGGNGGQKINI